VRGLFSRRLDPTAALATTVVGALVANAFVCGALSGPHDRYGARLAWVATLVVAVALAHAIRRLGEPRKRPQSASS